MGQAVLFGILKLREDFDVLMIVYFEVSQQQLAGRIVHRERLLETQDSRVELAGRRQIVRSQTDMSHADDRRTRYRLQLLLGS